MTDRFTVRAVVIGLILVALTVIAALVYAMGVVSLTAEQRGTILGVLASMGTGALGAVAGILARTASPEPTAPGGQPPAPVEPAPVNVVAP